MSSIYGQQLAQANAQTATAQTDTELVAAQTGRTIKVASVFVSSAAAMTVTLESGTATRKLEAYVGANSTFDAAGGAGGFLFECAAGEALTFTTSAAGATFVSVSYVVI